MSIFLSEKRSFRLRKPESLDWKKIASLDIEKFIQENDDETLKEFLPQIAFCQPDIEFDHNKTDPGFRKVFRLGQLIIEHLIESQDELLEKANSIEQKYAQALEQKKEHEEEIQRLRDRLLDAKKELKRRKEMIESNQVELMGAQNKDEYDQCPYCTKKFINSIYLYSHLQRRHQGLPIHPAFNFPNQSPGGTPLEIGSGTFGSKTEVKVIEKVTAFTQTVTEEDDDGNYCWKMNNSQEKIVNDLVEQYLQQRMGQTLDVYHNVSQKSEEKETRTPTPPRLPSSLEILKSQPLDDSMLDKSMIDMKEDLESQWRNLIEKMHKTELDEFKSTLLDEMHKMQEIIVKSTTKVNETDSDPRPPTKGTSPSNSLVGKVEQRFQKQEDELESLKQNLQTKIQTDIQLIESRLESQERFWRAKLRTVEDEYQKHIANLREEFQASILQQKMVERSSNRVKWPSDEDMMHSVKPATPVTSSSTGVVMTLTDTRVDAPVPKPKPRTSTTRIINCVEIVEEPRFVLGLPPKIPKEARSPVKMVYAPAVPVPKEYEDPKPVQTNGAKALQTSKLESETTSESVGTYSIFSARSPVKTKGTQSKWKTRTADTTTVTSFEGQTEVEDPRAKPVNKPRKEALEEMHRDLKAIGLNPADKQLPRNQMKESLKRLKARRKALNEELEHFVRDREIQKQETNQKANTKMLEAQVTAINEAGRLRNKPLQHPTQSPFVKIFRAVKSSGTTLKRKMSSMATAKPKVKTMSPRTRPRFGSPNAGQVLKKPVKKIAPPPPVEHSSPKKAQPVKTIFQLPCQKTKGFESASDVNIEHQEKRLAPSVFRVAADLGKSTPVTKRPSISKTNEIESPSPGPSTRTYERRGKTAFHSSTNNGEPDLYGSPSLSSVTVSSVTEVDSDFEKPSPVPKSAKQKEDRKPSCFKSPEPETPLKTLIYHDPYQGLNKFGLKDRIPSKEEHSSDESSNLTSTSSIVGGTKGKPLKRLQKQYSRSSSGSDSSRSYTRPVTAKNQIFSPKNQSPSKRNNDALNNPSDWDVSVTDSGKKAGNKSKLAEKTPTLSRKSLYVKQAFENRPPFLIPGINSKRKDYNDNSWDAD